IQSLCEPERAALPRDDTRLDECAHALLEEEGVAPGAGDQQTLERLEWTAHADEGIEECRGTFGGERIDPQLRVVAPAAPGVLVLGAIVDEQQDARRRQALDEVVEKRLGLAVDPVQILEEQHDRLDLALAKHDVLDGIEDSLTTLRRAEGLPGGVRHRNAEQRQQRWERAAKIFVEREELAGDLLPDG